MGERAIALERASKARRNQGTSPRGRGRRETSQRERDQPAEGFLAEPWVPCHGLIGREPWGAANSAPARSLCGPVPLRSMASHDGRKVTIERESSRRQRVRFAPRRPALRFLSSRDPNRRCGLNTSRCHPSFAAPGSQHGKAVASERRRAQGRPYRLVCSRVIQRDPAMSAATR